VYAESPGSTHARRSGGAKCSRNHPQAPGNAQSTDSPVRRHIEAGKLTAFLLWPLPAMRHFGFVGMNAEPLTGGRFDDAGMAAGALGFFGFFGSRLLRC
jgi:hypothetical protein